MKRAMDRWSSLLCTVLASAAVLLCWLTVRAQTPQVSQPKKLMVHDVVVHGNHRMPTQAVLNYVRTRPGVAYDLNIVNEDIRRLYETRQFTSEIKFTLEQDKPTEGECIVHIYLQEMPSTVQFIEYRGRNHASEEDLETSSGIKRGSPMNPILNRKACKELERYYHDKGRPFAQVRLVEGFNVSDTRVVFDIQEGPIVHVRKIEYEGCEFVSGGVLNTHTISSRAFLGFIGGKYQESMVLEDIRRLTEYYRSFGYLAVRIEAELIPDPLYQYVTLVYHVQEGNRFRVETAQVLDNGKFKEQLVAQQPFHQGEFYDDNKVKVAVARMQDWVGSQGYECKVEPIKVTNAAGSEVAVSFQVQEMCPQPLHVGLIKIIGNDRTRQNVILRQLQVWPGQVLSFPDLRVSERNLERLGIFENSPETGVKPTVEVLPPTDPNSPFRDVLVTVKEAPTGSLLFGLGVNSDSGLVGSVALNERNFDITNWPTSFDDLLSGGAFRGAGQEFRAEAVPGTVTQRYSVSFREPYLFDSLFSLKLDAYFYDRIYNEYTEQRIGGRATFGRRLNENWTVTASTRIEDVNVYGLPALDPAFYPGLQQDLLQFYGDHLLVGQSVGVTYDTRDSFLRPTDGMIASAAFEECFGDYTFSKATAEISKYFTVWQRPDGSGRHVVDLRSQIAWASEDTPVYERYYGGGFQSMRGFEFRGVGPDDYGFKVGGDFMWLNSVEYQIPILANDKFYAVAFVDSGTVEREVELGTYRVAAGFGFRISVPALGPVPIALDFGFPIVKASTDSTQVFSFWVGWFH